MTFLIKRGRRARFGQARAHLAHYDAHGRIDRAWCGWTGCDMACNLPLGLRICKHCKRKAAS